MDAEAVLRALRQTPEVRLALIDLVWQVVREDGSTDPQQISFHSEELEKVIAEARAYSSATREAVRCLIEMARSPY